MVEYKSGGWERFDRVRARLTGLDVVSSSGAVARQIPYDEVIRWGSLDVYPDSRFATDITQQRQETNNMPKWLQAVQLGIEILSDVEALLTGQATSFDFSWKGRKFTVNIQPQ